MGTTQVGRRAIERKVSTGLTRAPRKRPRLLSVRLLPVRLLSVGLLSAMALDLPAGEADAVDLRLLVLDGDALLVQQPAGGAVELPQHTPVVDDGGNLA